MIIIRGCRFSSSADDVEKKLIEEDIEDFEVGNKISKENITITNAAKEPEIIDLVQILNKMGAKISGAGTEKITIHGVNKLKKDLLNVLS